MRIEHRVYRPKRLIDINHVVQRTFPWNKDRLAIIEGFIDVAHDTTRTIAGYLAATKPFMVFAITDGQNVGQQSIFTFVAKLRENRLRHLL